MCSRPRAVATTASRSCRNADSRAAFSAGSSSTAAAWIGTWRGARSNSLADRVQDRRPPWAAEQHDRRIGQGDQRRERRRSPRGRRRRAAAAAAALDVDRGRAGATQAERREHLGQWHGHAAGSDGHQVRDLAGQAGVAAADLAVADDGAAEAFAEVEVDEVVACGRRVLGAGGPVDVVVDDDRAVDDVGRARRRDRARRPGTGRPGAATSRPVARSTGSAALTTASRYGPGRRASSRSVRRHVRPAPVRARLRARRRRRRRRRSPRRRSPRARGSRRARARRRRRARSRSRPGRARVVRSPVSTTRRPPQPPHALGDRRLGEPGRGGDLGAGGAPCAISARSTCSSESDRSSSRVGFAVATEDILVRTLA